MKVESAEQGVRFEWTGEGSEKATEVAVALSGERQQNYDRLQLLKEVVRSARETPIDWQDLELRERLETVDGTVVLGGKHILMWRADFYDWQSAGVCFTALCHAVGMADDSTELEIEI